ncbi:MAG: AI-2E family transporter [Gaiellaceae bacterium]|jgi:putative heme transporter
MRLHIPKHRRGQDGSVVVSPVAVEIGGAQLDALSTVFSPPRWLRDLGRAAWLIVGVLALLAALIWFLGATYTIVGPLVAASIVATVAMPLVGKLSRRMPRAAAAAVVLLGLVALGVFIVVIVIGGVTGQHDEIGARANSAADRAQHWLTSAGVDQSAASSASSSVKADVPAALSTLATGVIAGIRGLTSLVFGLSLAALSLFFLLKDGPSLRAWVDDHLGVPAPVAQTITGDVIRSLRGYFRGVTLVSAFNGVVVSIGALLLGVPLVGTIAVVTFVTAYIPYLGAFIAGAFAVVVALGASGTTTALIMLLIVILANGLLQNLVQPFAMGSALNLNPLVVLVATIAGGCIFGTIGLILAAPLLSAAVHITNDLARARLAAAADAAPAPTAAADSAPAVL